jgi:hypothetical protein
MSKPTANNGFCLGTRTRCDPGPLPQSSAPGTRTTARGTRARPASNGTWYFNCARSSVGRRTSDFKRVQLGFYQLTTATATMGMARASMATITTACMATTTATKIQEEVHTGLSRHRAALSNSRQVLSKYQRRINYGEGAGLGSTRESDKPPPSPPTSHRIVRLGGALWGSSTCWSSFPTVSA